MSGNFDEFSKEIKRDMNRALNPARARLDQSRAQLLDRMYFTDAEDDSKIVSVRRDSVDYHAAFTLAPSQTPSTAIYLKERGNGGTRQFHLVQESDEEVTAALNGTPTRQTVEAWKRRLPEINKERVDDMLRSLRDFELGVELRVSQAEGKASAHLNDLKRTRNILAPTPVDQLKDGAKGILGYLIPSKDEPPQTEDEISALAQLDMDIAQAELGIQGIKLYRDEYLDVCLQVCQEKREEFIKEANPAEPEKWMDKEMAQLREAYGVSMRNETDFSPLTHKWQDAVRAMRGEQGPRNVVPLRHHIPTLDGDS